jgi:hypothetical protein
MPCMLSRRPIAGLSRWDAVLDMFFIAANLIPIARTRWVVGECKRMRAERTDGPVLEGTEFVGQLSLDDETVPITFRVSVGSDCRLHVDPVTVDARTYHLAARSLGRPGSDCEELALTGASTDGKTISSKHVFICGYGHDDSRRWIDLKSIQSEITVPLDRRVEKPVMQLWLRSFRSFSNPVTETSLGKLAVWGAAGHVAPDDMSGCVCLQASSADPGDGWRKNADDFLRHLQQGLALAHGGRLQTPRLDYINELTREMILFDGTGVAPEFPVQYHLNHGPFIQALVHRYQTKGSLSDDLWKALDWTHTDTSFDEMRFLSGMIAVEVIIRGQLPKEYRKKPLRNRIYALFDHYVIPREDFEDEVICKLVDLRNEIVHEGGASNAADLWPSIILVRELISRNRLESVATDLGLPMRLPR